MGTTTFDAIKHPRKGGASNTGNAGHFAAKTLTEADPDLDLGFLDQESGSLSEDFDLSFTEGVDAPTPGFGMLNTVRTDPDPYYGSLRESELYDFTRAKARMLAADYDNIDADTLVSEAVVSYMSAVRNVSATTGVDKPVSPVATDPAKAKGFLFNAMKNIARREAFGTDGHDMKGHRELAKAVEAEIQATGAQPTSARLDELAEQVRLSFPPRRRPSVGFHRKMREVSMDAATDTGASPTLSAAERALSEQATTGHTQDFETGSLGEQVSTRLEQSSGSAAGAARAAAVRSIWDVVREGSDAPGVAAGSLSETEASTLRKDLAAAGGVREAIKAWNAAEDDHPALTCVFTPFGEDLTDDDRCAIMDTLAQRPAYAPDLLNAAITTATASRKKKDD